MNIVKISAAETRTKVLITMLLAFGFIFFGFNSISLAKDVTLQWDANSEPDLAGYRVYYKANSSGQPSGDYDTVVDAGNTTSKTIEGLEDDIVYYFAVTAYDTSGLESDFSNEITTAPVVTLPDEGSSPNLMTAGTEPDSIVLYAQGGYFPDSYYWALASNSVGSLSANGRTAIFASPENIPGEIATATVELRNGGVVVGQQLITIYNPVAITNKIDSDQTVFAGEPITFSVQGGDGTYTWTITKDGGLVGLYSGESCPFNATAGIYTITVSDGNNFIDSFSVNVIDNTSSSSNTGNEDEDTSTASSTGTVSGYIVDDEEGRGIENAEVNLWFQNQLCGSTVTTSDGFFSFENVPDADNLNYSEVSSTLLYEIITDHDYPVIITLSFDLSLIDPGDFEAGKAVIYRADTIDDFTSGVNLETVNVDDIISSDYEGDGSTGLIEFYADSPSIFGIGFSDESSISVGSISTQTPSDSGGGGGGGCFISTLADTSGDTSGFQRVLILFGVVVLLGLLGWKFKNESMKKA